MTVFKFVFLLVMMLKMTNLRESSNSLDSSDFSMNNQTNKNQLNQTISTLSIFDNNQKPKKFRFPDTFTNILYLINNSLDKNVIDNKYNKTFVHNFKFARNKRKKLGRGEARNKSNTKLNAEQKKNAMKLCILCKLIPEQKFKTKNISKTNFLHKNLVTELYMKNLLNSSNNKLENYSLSNKILNINSDYPFSIDYGNNCEKGFKDFCWFEKEIGDTLTLQIKASFKEDLKKQIDIEWMKAYYQQNNKIINITLQQEKLPWNMVFGSDKTELRLNPISNSDTDPNYIIARVFLVKQRKGKELYQSIKELMFRINIPVIDMGAVSSGDEININLENFLTLPLNGNLNFYWGIENSPYESRSLPSNFIMSLSKRSVVIKTLKKQQTGILSCIVYSSNGFAVAKRRFNIHKIGEMTKRDTYHHLARPSWNDDSYDDGQLKVKVKKQPDCPPLDENLSRKGRLIKLEKYKNCNKKQRLHARWLFSLLFQSETTTLDPRLMSVEKLLELSANGDATLDGFIPHEIHYVQPVIRLIWDPYPGLMNPMSFKPNCSSDTHCGLGGYCVVPQGLMREYTERADFIGYCYCMPEYYGDGFTCTKIPNSKHRDKRIRRNANQDFYDMENDLTDNEEGFPAEEKEGFPVADSASSLPNKVLGPVTFEEEDSYLLSSCLDKYDCSPHAFCKSKENLSHSFCKCSMGYRGNGIFCWELPDFVN